MTDKQRNPVDLELARAVADLVQKRAELASIEAWHISENVAALTRARDIATRLLNDSGPSDSGSRAVAANDQIRAAGSELRAATEVILHSAMTNVDWWDDTIRRAIDVYRAAGLALQTIDTSLAPDADADARHAARMLLTAADNAMALGADARNRIKEQFDALGQPSIDDDEGRGRSRCRHDDLDRAWPPQGERHPTRRHPRARGEY